MNFINYLDIAIIVIFLMITIMGCVVGFTGKILSILGWSLAGMGAFYLYPYATPIAHQYIENSLFADIAAGGILFFILLIFFLVIAKLIANFVKKSPLSFLDRSLGMFLGMFLGLIFLSLMTFSLDFLVPQSQLPQVVKDSKLYPFLKITAAWVEKKIPSAWTQRLEHMGSEVRHQTKDLAHDLIEQEKISAALDTSKKEKNLLMKGFSE